MIKNYFKTAFRNIVSQPIFSIINITGLVIAITSVVLISLWVQDEKSYDKFHLKSDRIHRVIMNMGDHGNLAMTPPPLANKIKEEFPEVEYSTRIQDCPQVVVKNENHNFNENKGIFVDPDFFEIFSFNLLDGNQQNLINEPFNIVVTKDFANRYFKDGNVINNNLSINGNPVTISGVLDNIPANSHLQFDFILPIELLELLGEDLSDWGNVNVHSYIRVKKDVEWTTLNEKIVNWQTPRKESFFLQPLEEIHTEPGMLADNAVVSDKKYINIFIVVALIILIIASINYITIYISSALKRIREIGLRKINGSNKKNLILQFLSESIVFIFITLFLSTVLIRVLLPYFNNIVNKELSFQLLDTKIIVGLLFIGFLLLIFIGIYPALFFSSLKPSILFKKDTGKFGIVTKLKRGMILIQFSVTTILIIGVFTVLKQLEFIENKDLGFQKENIIYLPFNGIAEHYESMKEEVLKNPSVLNVTAKNSLPIENANKTDEIFWPGMELDQKLLVEATGVDYNYIETMNMTLSEGRSFSEQYETDKSSAVLNRTAVRQMNLKDPIGKTINLWGFPLTVIGVVNDGLFYSLKKKSGPQIYYMIQDINEDEMTYYGKILINVKERDIQETISQIQNVWSCYYPEIPFDFNFLDKAIDQRYWEERRLFSVIKYFVVLSLILSCMGLYGLSLFSTKQRIKEIGVRKVNGAKISEILTMLNKDFVLWAGIAYAISVPVAYIIMYKWLNNFAYKIMLSWWIFALAGIFALTTVLLTISWQSWRAARRNPVEALRYE